MAVEALSTLWDEQLLGTRSHAFLANNVMDANVMDDPFDDGWQDTMGYGYDGSDDDDGYGWGDDGWAHNMEETSDGDLRP